MHVIPQSPLSRSAAADVMRTLLAEISNEEYVLSVLTSYHQRGVVAEELLGFWDILQGVSVSVDLGTSSFIDLCGTGGDGKNTFNISTTTAFVVAGAGIPVAKHGNNAFSSSVGSSDVLKALGVQLHDDPYRLRGDLESCGSCFLHAPFFHPKLKGFAILRRKLGHSTIFNLLGPLLNPANPRYQCIGVRSPDLIDLYCSVLGSKGVQFSVVHSLDGYDEISLTGDFVVATLGSRQVYSPEQLGLLRCCSEDLKAPDSVERAAELIESILQRQGTESHEAVVIANAGFAIRTYYPELSVQDALDCARSSLASGRAYSVLSGLRRGCIDPDGKV
jgi:anthranilate phosphoribosyltransferase